MADPLTGLPNRAAFMEVATERFGGRSCANVAVVVVDLTRFSALNHALGFAAGDRVLREVAARLSSLAGSAFVARIGSDQFGLVADEAQAADVRGLAAIIQREAARALPCVDAPFAISPIVTIGAATATAAEGLDAVLQRAETALHVAKARGGGSLEVFDPGMHAAFLSRRLLELELFGAGDRGELRAHYQPIVELESGRVVGLEALVRWDRPGEGLLLPGRFIGAAEACGAVVPLGEWILDHSLRQALEWNRWLKGQTPLVTSVNVSACQLRAPRFVDAVADVIRAVGIDPGLVNLEVTETALMADTESMIAVLGQLKDLGVLLALDDFGTGYSSLSYLRRLPVDVVKIDRAFVSGVASDSDEWALAVAIVRLATKLGKRTLAEGIETAAQLAHLRSLGCDLGQGFLFAPPLEPAAAWDFISASPSGVGTGVGGLTEDGP